MPLTTINIEEDQLESLEEIAKNEHKDVSYIIAKIIDDYFENLLDKELLIIAKQRSADIKAGKSKLIPHEEIKAKYGL